jgi:hypothetical protein
MCRGTSDTSWDQSLESDDITGPRAARSDPDVARKLLSRLGMPQKEPSKTDRKSPSKQEGRKQEARGKEQQDVSEEQSTGKKSSVRKGGAGKHQN